MITNVREALCVYIPLGSIEHESFRIGSKSDFFEILAYLDFIESHTDKRVAWEVEKILNKYYEIFLINSVFLLLKLTDSA
ncbi:MAG: hypothetical protein V7K48_08070 [Nostoc sp.]|uniref:hypothetical protein n=1 Tax=Nostoc sp. TaxID=1180 RepID=UPI002FFB7E73